MEQLQAHLLMEFTDREKKENITLKKVVYGNETRYRVKWTHEISEDDIRVDFTELTSYEMARETFSQFVRQHLSDDK